MKARLLKKARKMIKLYKRNSFFYVDIRKEYGNNRFDTLEEALEYRRYRILDYARCEFGFKPKQEL